jgi:short-subunit dehydrogenase
MNNLANKVAAITGAGSGIGRATAIALAKRGCHLAIADINTKNLQETATLVSSYGVNCSCHTIDVSDRTAVKNFANETVTAHGKVNIIINNAGIALAANVDDMSYDDFERVMAINFWGVVYGCKEFLPHIKTAGEGHIVNLSSMFGLVACASQSAYNASKFAVRGFTEALHQELLIEQSPIGCSAIYPGFIKTAIMENAKFVGLEKHGLSKAQAASDFNNSVTTTAEQVADAIIHCIEKQKPRALIGGDAKWLDFLQRLMPSAHQAIMASIRKKQYRTKN